MYRIVVVGEHDALARSLLDAVSLSRDAEWLHTGVHVRHWSCAYASGRPALELELLELPADPMLRPPLVAIMSRAAALVLVYDSGDVGAFDRLVQHWAPVMALGSEVPSFRVLVASRRDAHAAVIPRVECELVARQWRVAAHYCVAPRDEPASVRRFFVELCRRLVAAPRLPRIDPGSRDLVASPPRAGHCSLM